MLGSQKPSVCIMIFSLHSSYLITRIFGLQNQFRCFLKARRCSYIEVHFNWTTRYVFGRCWYLNIAQLRSKKSDQLQKSKFKCFGHFWDPIKTMRLQYQSKFYWIFLMVPLPNILEESLLNWLPKPDISGVISIWNSVTTCMLQSII